MADEPVAEATTETEAPVEQGAVTIIATEFEFDAPESIAGGMTEIEFVNEGEHPHGLVLARLLEGKTPEDLIAVLSEEVTAIPEWLSFPGGVGGIESGQTATAVLDLDPGQYMMFSFETAPGQELPDFAQGMIQALEVTEPAATQASAPEHDLTMALADFSFIQEGEFEAGEQMMRVENMGEQLHEVIIVRLAEGVTAEQLAEMMAGPPPAEGEAGEGAEEEGASEEGAAEAATPEEDPEAAATPEEGDADAATPEEGSSDTAASDDEGESDDDAASDDAAAPEGPPFTSVGGMPPIDFGRSGFVSVNLTPGNYVMLCFVPDPADGLPHAAKGMLKAFTVE